MVITKSQADAAELKQRELENIEREGQCRQSRDQQSGLVRRLRPMAPNPAGLTRSKSPRQRTVTAYA